jgi:hypothetical protein
MRSNICGKNRLATRRILYRSLHRHNTLWIHQRSDTLSIIHLSDVAEFQDKKSTHIVSLDPLVLCSFINSMAAVPPFSVAPVATQRLQVCAARGTR